MGAIDYYTCQNCGSDIDHDNIFFYFDETKEETIDFLHLFSTVGIDRESKIKGRINITFCKYCKKTFKIYIIDECSIKNPEEIIYNGIFNHIKHEIQRLKEIKKKKIL